MKTPKELNAKDVHKIAWQIQHHDRTELSKVMSVIEKAAYDGNFSARYEGVISDSVLTILSIKGFKWDDNRKYAWTDKSKPTIDIYWTEA